MSNWKAKFQKLQGSSAPAAPIKQAALLIKAPRGQKSAKDDRNDSARFPPHKIKVVVVAQPQVATYSFAPAFKICGLVTGVQKSDGVAPGLALPAHDRTYWPALNGEVGFYGLKKKPQETKSGKVPYASTLADHEDASGFDVVALKDTTRPVEIEIPCGAGTGPNGINETLLEDITVGSHLVLGAVSGKSWKSERGAINVGLTAAYVDWTNKETTIAKTPASGAEALDEALFKSQWFNMQMLLGACRLMGAVPQKVLDCHTQKNEDLVLRLKQTAEDHADLVVGLAEEGGEFQFISGTAKKAISNTIAHLEGSMSLPDCLGNGSSLRFPGVVLHQMAVPPCTTGFFLGSVTRAARLSAAVYSDYALEEAEGRTPKGFKAGVNFYLPPDQWLASTPTAKNPKPEGISLAEANELKARIKLACLSTWTLPDESGVVKVGTPSTADQAVMTAVLIFNMDPLKGAFLPHQKGAGLLANAFGTYPPLAVQCALEELLPFSQMVVTVRPTPDKLPPMQVIEQFDVPGITPEYWPDMQGTTVSALKAIETFPTVSKEFVAKHLSTERMIGETGSRYCDPKRQNEANYPSLVPPTLQRDGFVLLNDSLFNPTIDPSAVNYHVVAFGMSQCMGEKGFDCADVCESTEKGEAFIEEHFKDVLSGDRFYLLYAVAKKPSVDSKKRKAETAAPDDSDDD